MTVSSEAGELRCTGSISGSKFQTARLVLNRNPNLPVYKDGYNEELCKLTGPGEINAKWKLASRIFEECLFVFHPGILGTTDFETVAQWLGAPRDDFTGIPPPALVVGDGPGTDYKLRLFCDHRFGRTRSDETRLVVT